MTSRFLLFLALILTSSFSFSQTASNYFPSSTGYKWYYKNTPLDSLNNPIQSQATYQIDSFANVTTYKGLTASRILSKSGLISLTQNAPYSDTSYYNFQGSNAWYYLNVLSLIGSIPLIDSIEFVNFLRSFEAWYDTYRFAQQVNNNYTIFQKDTTLTIDTLVLPLRLSTVGRRLNDQTVSTVNGNYLAKKFLLTFTLSYGLLPPFIYVPIITRPDTIYFAENVWRIKEVMPSTNVDLTSIGINLAFSIPGSMKELTQAPSGIITHNSSIASEFRLFQNYPNPFNPVTVITFSIPKPGLVTLKIYDILGKEVTTLINEILPAGSYETEFTGNGLSSGVYFYRLESGEFLDVKRMTLAK